VGPFCDRTFLVRHGKYRDSEEANTLPVRSRQLPKALDLESMLGRQSSYSGSEVGLEEIAIVLLQARLWTASSEGSFRISLLRPSILLPDHHAKWRYALPDRREPAPRRNKHRAGAHTNKSARL
jgi:hypothetical protein